MAIEDPFSSGSYILLYRMAYFLQPNPHICPPLLPRGSFVNMAHNSSADIVLQAHNPRSWLDERRTLEQQYVFLHAVFDSVQRLASK